jgi:hypothetical protein
MPLDRRLVMACVVAAVAVAALPAGTGSANTVEAWPPPGVWFTPGSFWNQPHDGDHRSPNSDRYIADLKDAVCAGHPSDCFVHLSGTSGDAWGSPFYDGSTQPTKRPVVCSDPQGDCHGFPPSDTFWLHLPADTSNTPPTFKPSNDSDSVMVVIDPSPDAGYVVWLHHACPPGRYGTEFCASNGSRDWTADSMSIYSLTSDGLEGCWPKQYPDDFPVPPVGHSDEDNNGHRGFPGAYSGVRWSDAVRAGRISHVLKIAVPDTASAHFFPYVNDEGGSGTIPEGSLIRIKSGIDLTLRKYRLRGPSLAIAQALQTYGAIVGDQGGNGSPNLKVENLQAEGSPSTWADVGIDPDSLSEIPLDAYEFAAGGEWGPHPHASLCNGALDPER